MSKIKVSIIIVSWNVRHYIERCLVSINKNTRSHYEIIVVDNASEDRTTEFIKANWPELTLIENNMNQGFGCANNQGINIAHGKYIVFLNPDTEILRNAIDSLVDFMEYHPTVGIAGGMLINPDGSLQFSLRNFPNPMRDFLYISGLTTLFRWIQSKCYSARDFRNHNNIVLRHNEGYLSGAFLIVRKVLLENIGMFDEDYSLYFEDTDLCYRALKKGSKIAYVPSAKVIHHAGQSSIQIGEKAYSLYCRNLFLFYKKCGSLGKVQQARMAVLIGSVARFFILLFSSIGSIKSFAQHLNTCFTIARMAYSKTDDNTKLFHMERNV